MQEEPKEVKHCWQESRATVWRQGVPLARADWFVRWAQRLARAMPGIPLWAPTKAHVRAFLRDLTQQAHVESRRLVTFHELKSPRELGPEAVKAYREYLAGERYDSRTVQELRGHADVATTMIDTHVLNTPGLAVQSPAHA